MNEMFADLDPDDFSSPRIERTGCKKKAGGDRQSLAELAKECERLKSDEERRPYFEEIKDKHHTSLDSFCPALLVLARDVRDPAFRSELATFFVAHLADERSRFTRKTCAFALKQNFLTADHWALNEFFVLLSTLEETQFHLVEPALSKLTLLSAEIDRNPECPLKWIHLRAAFLLALRHVNGWVRCNTIRAIIKLPASLIGDDMEFVVDVFYRHLNSAYDVYWRAAEVYGGIEGFLDELRAFGEQFQRRDFYLRLLRVYSLKLGPTPYFFTTVALPRKGARLLTEEDLPAIRLAFAEADYIMYPKLQHNAYFNLYNFLQLVCKFKDEASWQKVRSWMPAAVRRRVGGGEVLESKEAGSKRNRLPPAALEQVEKWTRQKAEEFDLTAELSALLEFLAVNSTAGRLMEFLLQLIPRASEEQQEEILKTFAFCFADSKRTSLVAATSAFNTRALLSAEKVAVDRRLNQMEALLEQAEKNVQCAFAISRAFFEFSAVPADFLPALIQLAIYGSIPTKEEEVVRFAHAIALDFGLDEITDFDRIGRRVREMAIVKLLRMCLNEHALINPIVRLALQKYEQVQREYKTHSFGLSNGHRLKTRCFIILLLFFGLDGVVKRLSSENVEAVITACYEAVLNGDQQMSIRLPSEWILSLRCARDPAFFDDFVARAPAMAKIRCGSVASWIAIVARALKSKATAAQLRTALLNVLPWVSVQNFASRAMAMAAVRLLVQWHADEIAADRSLCFAHELARFDVEVAGNSQKIFKTLLNEPWFTQMAVEDVNLYTIYFLLPKMCGMPADELVFEQLPDGEEELRAVGVLKPVDPALDISQSWIFAGISNHITARTESKAPEKTADTNGDSADFEIQQKLNTLEREFQQADTKWETNDGKQLIVVASHVNKAANLGGLARTCEIFNVKELVVADAEVVNDFEFRSLSMSAECWLTITEVKPLELAAYLEECRRKGFQIVAAEQTSQSIALDKFDFPPKTVVLLGDERKGVPADLLRCVDSTVEISQLGRTRSLNVHVSASLFVYQWAVQHLIQ